MELPMPRLLACLLALLILAVVAAPVKNVFADHHEGDDAPAAVEDVPVVTPDQVINLFNGQDLNGWSFELRGEGDTAQVFRVEDGLIKISGSPAGIMRTDVEYRDYELEVQWRWVAAGGNSGVLIHCSTPNERNVWPKSIECQLAANNAGDFWVIGETLTVRDPDTRTSGRRTVNYTDDSENELGQWNSMTVQARGDTVKVFVNGVLVNEGWDCSADHGAICLQSEGQAIEYRLVQLRPLPAEAGE